MMGPSGAADQLTAILGLMSDPKAAEKRLKDITAAEERLSRLQVEANNDIEAANVAKEQAADAVQKAERAEGKANAAKAEAEAAKRLAKSEKQTTQQGIDEQRSELENARILLDQREKGLATRQADLEELRGAVEAESRHVKGLAAELRAKGKALKDAVKAAEGIKL